VDRHEAGFTLVELMVVTLIIGILVSVAIPIFVAAKASTSQTTCFANQRTVVSAAQDRQAAKGSLPPAGIVDSSNVLITDGFLLRAPRCPSGQQFYELGASGFIVAASLTCGHPLN
jgi:prepilin-type N-terminal cleavage/methylation domain-containing protein